MTDYTARLISNNMFMTVHITNEETGEMQEFFDDIFINAFNSDEPCFYDWLGGTETEYAPYQYGETIAVKHY